MTQIRSSYCPQTGLITPELRYTHRTVPGTPMRHYIWWYVLDFWYICCPGRGSGTFTASTLDENNINGLLRYHLPGRRHSHSSPIKLLVPYRTTTVSLRSIISIAVLRDLVQYCRTTAELSINYCYLRWTPEMTPRRNVADHGTK